jgi:subtilase family serine protease
MRLALPVAAAAGALTLAAAFGGATATAPAARGPAAARAPAMAVVIRPELIHVATVLKSLPTTAFCEQNYGIACYQPKQIQRGFDLPALYSEKVRGKRANGAGQTIIIVDSYGSPTVSHDLKVFDAGSGLPAPPSLRIIQPAGKVAPYQPTSDREGWAGETDLDVESAHTIAPGASILLAETPTSENEGTTGFPQIVTAEEYAVNHHLGGVISQSFSATEQTFPSRRSLLSLRGAYVDASRKGVTVLAASGDSGAADLRYNGNDYYLQRVTSWPDSDPLVTGVGGAQLHLNAAGQPTSAPSVWNDTYNAPANEFLYGDRGPNPLAGGGGKSVIFARPRYQYAVRNVVGAARGVPDISMSGACNGAADMYQSFKGQPAGWYPTCGTSEATPEFAGIVALADQVAGHPLGPINPDLYQLLARHSPGIVDITSGNNTVSFVQGGKQHTVRGLGAAPGYDLASGIGTVDARTFVYALANAARHRGA